MRPDSSNPSEILDQRLKLYSVVALAAGVGVLAMAQPAQGEVVVTKKKIQLTAVRFGVATATVDLNNDGVADFNFSLSSGGYGHSFKASLLVTPLTGGEVVGTAGAVDPYASALMRGAKVGPSAHFSSAGKGITVERSHGTVSASTRFNFYGKWKDVGNNRFLGVKFLINGQTHYGWIRLSVSINPTIDAATITGYAYETVPNKRIMAGVAPAPSATTSSQVNAPMPTGASLGMLALGTDGLALWRREQDRAA
jgi:hypothetical protein